MTTNPSKPTIAFFGATGGCALATVSLALTAGYNCSALARTPQKLTTALLSRGIPRSTLDALLTIHEGNATSPADVRTAISSPTPADIIISGVGGRPKRGFLPVLDNPNICQSFTKTLLDVIPEVYSGPKKPLLCVISTTGLESKRDIPLAVVPLYHWLLSVPHEDKKIMEDLVTSPSTDALLSGWIVVRPSLLANGEFHGHTRVRAGYEGRVKKGDGRWGDVEGHAPIGYVVTREDIGHFIFEEVVERGGGEWVGRKICVTT